MKRLHVEVTGHREDRRGTLLLLLHKLSKGQRFEGPKVLRISRNLFLRAGLQYSPSHKNKKPADHRQRVCLASVCSNQQNHLVFT